MKSVIASRNLAAMVIGFLLLAIGFAINEYWNNGDFGWFYISWCLAVASGGLYVVNPFLDLFYIRYAIVLNEGLDGNGKKYYLMPNHTWHPNIVDNIALFDTSYKAIMLMKELQQIEKNDCLKIERVI